MKQKLLYIFLLLLFFLPTFAGASTTDGTIDPTYNRARFINGTGGYINFAASQGNVHVTDAGMTGYAWSENYGWINLNPANGGVLNDAEGTLSGYAWGEKMGWINFKPTNGGVTIDANGNFLGYAWSEKLGWISFNCATEGNCGSTSYKVMTDWRPLTVRNSTSTPGGGGSGGGGGGGGGCVTGCTPPPSFDVCPNIAGNQTSVPPGLVVNLAGSCVAPQACLALPQQLKQSLDVMLVIDLSGSMNDTIGGATKISQAKAAAITFVNSLDPNSDKVGLATFANTSRLENALTSVFGPVNTKINSLVVSGGTNIGDGIQTAHNELVAHGRSNAKHIIILLTDGYVNAPGTNPYGYAVGTSNTAKSGADIIYTIGLGSTVDASFLKTVATQASNYYYSPTGSDLQNIYLQISAIECTSQTSNVSGKIIQDQNGNGVYDQGELGFSGATIDIISTNASQPMRVAVTLSDGSFNFSGVAPGDYLVCSEQQGSYTQTYPLLNNGCFSISIIQGYSVNELVFALTSGAPPTSGDSCNNISGIQTSIPLGLVSDGSGNCIPPGVTPTDLCSNISGNQFYIPDGMILDEQAQCVIPLQPVDVCPNMAGNQAFLPAGMEYDSLGNCTPITNADLCPNIAGAQTTVPSNMSINSQGDCVTIVSDMCPNIMGTQGVVPLGMVMDIDGNCVAATATRDVCVNISGTQNSVPAGMTVDGDGNCTLIPLSTDVCPNITGEQSSIPGGMRYDSNGNCITPPPPCVGILCNLPTIDIPSLPPLPSLPPVFQGYVDSGTNTVGDIQRALQDIYKDPNVSITGKAFSLIGLIVGLLGALSALFLTPLSLAELVLLPFRLWSLLMSLLGFKKKYRPWGTVYDSVTKQPLDPAYVVLKDSQGNDISTAITDLDGRYGFLTQGGSFSLVANKTNYTFPSEKLAGKTSDELYTNLYFGGLVTVDAKTAVIDRNIPLDPQNFDWNEFAKRNKNLMKFYSARDRMFHKLADLFFRLGFICALVGAFVTPEPYNFIIVAAYLVIIVLRKMGIRGRSYGFITETETGNPLSFAIIRIISPSLRKEIFHKVADQFGRYYCLVPKGNYIVRIERKNPDESYSVVAEMAVLAPRGIINQGFKV